MQSQHETLMQDPEFRKEFAIETFVAECTEVISRIMHQKQISKADLARRLGKSRAWVTQLLSGGRNVTVRTLAEVAYELNSELVISPKLPAVVSHQAKLPKRPKTSHIHERHSPAPNARRDRSS
jgi:transcriptional regulator with XRE-family HTH domain